MRINERLDDILSGDEPKGYEISYKHHIVFWLIYFAFNALRWGSVHDDLIYSLKTNLIGFPIHIALSYFNVYYLMPKFVFQKKYFTYALLIFISLGVMLLVKFNLTYYFISTNVMPEADEIVNTLTLNYAITTMLGELYVVSFVTAIKITADWLQENNKFHNLEKRQLTTELKFLRSQVSPHFFFNTLNNIYSLTLEKSDKAPEVVLKLSELMRYLLYATKKPKQNLKNEIDCIQNYIDLERIRFDDSLEVNMQISGDLENKKIAPMLLIPLIENCFKHGASKNIGKMHIDVDISVKEDFLYFNVSNTVPEKRKKEKSEKKIGGIGLSNVKKRLELGYGKNEYDLKISELDKKFHVELKLKV
ncbi:sensor histidine kinase [Maribacter sp. HTCC2170]|uniref:sensor histidine kinase n=1 Tax=Maribacter sp. (strain HTCC2170 / KCCM 42371) TaxID=313603 RepID=UPI00006BE0A4|nr:histidine kinase [Maribacter sp. HTCC2170]EAQ99995.1 putative two-component system sensor protein, without kinase domain [Maribacter sp. HTCC2170]